MSEMFSIKATISILTGKAIENVSNLERSLDGFLTKLSSTQDKISGVASGMSETLVAGVAGLSSAFRDANQAGSQFAGSVRSATEAVAESLVVGAKKASASLKEQAAERKAAIEKQIIDVKDAISRKAAEEKAALNSSSVIHNEYLRDRELDFKLSQEKELSSLKSSLALMTTAEVSAGLEVAKNKRMISQETLAAAKSDGEARVAEATRVANEQISIEKTLVAEKLKNITNLSSKEREFAKLALEHRVRSAEAVGAADIRLATQVAEIRNQTKKLETEKLLAVEKAYQQQLNVLRKEDLAYAKQIAREERKDAANSARLKLKEEEALRKESLARQRADLNIELSAMKATQESLSAFRKASLEKFAIDHKATMQREALEFKASQEASLAIFRTVLEKKKAEELAAKAAGLAKARALQEQKLIQEQADQAKSLANFKKTEAQKLAAERVSIERQLAAQFDASAASQARFKATVADRVRDLQYQSDVEIQEQQQAGERRIAIQQRVLTSIKNAEKALTEAIKVETANRKAAEAKAAKEVEQARKAALRASEADKTRIDLQEQLSELKAANASYAAFKKAALEQDAAAHKASLEKQTIDFKANQEVQMA
ncbi:MAG: hypothetical protein KDH96_02345, partial [Candidatus Riesia sp.]|nr:hypothetical protein [Candidatus Riesia sp.]